MYHKMGADTYIEYVVVYGGRKISISLVHVDVN